MDYKFQYSQYYKDTVSDLSKLQEILSMEDVVMDAAFLPILDQAEDGDFAAMCEICTLFSDGTNGVKPNYGMAKRYGNKILESVKATGERVSILESYANLAMIESKFGFADKAKDVFKQTFDYMIDNFHTEEVLNETHGFFHHIAGQFLEE
jgi:hypothetical protein